LDDDVLVSLEKLLELVPPGEVALPRLLLLVVD